MIDSALTLIESVVNDRVLFIGDRIVDEYHYAKPLGKSPKENIIPVEFQRSEIFQGGVIAAANHARSFVKDVSISYDGRITRKVRFVDDVYFRKLFEVHYSEDETLDDISTQRGDWDCIVVADFGHGAIGPQDCVSIDGDAFLAVAAQTNSSNIGFNLITKYPRADYIVIDEPEARLAAHDRDSPIEDVIMKLAKDRCPRFVVTQGRNGAVGYDGEFHYCPAVGNGALDSMGAGDAFFAVTAPMARHGSMSDLLLIGNAAGALKTRIIGHRKSVTKPDLIEFLKAHATD